MTTIVNHRNIASDYYPAPEQREKRMCRITYNDFCRQGCTVCGLVMPPYSPPGRVKEAHHRDPQEKLFSCSELSRKGNKWWPVLVAELRKCEPLCGNCHAVVHDIAGNHSDSWEDTLRLAREEVAQWVIPGVKHE